MTAARYIVGDTRDVTRSLPDSSVDLIFTSPPFLALRSYLPADHPAKAREIGSESTPAEFLGVLPCCNRHFTNVERHMASKHPNYGQGGA